MSSIFDICDFIIYVFEIDDWNLFQSLITQFLNYSLNGMKENGVFEHCISRFLYYASELMRENMDPFIRRIVEEHFSADLNNKFVNKFV